MFGYVNIYKDELKVKDYNLFRAYYCGLCKAIGKRGSQLARLGLSYDMTFLSLILSAVDNSEACIKKSRCIAHPMQKHAEICKNTATDYAADMSVILAHLKLYDDWKDEHSIKSLIGMLAYKNAVSKAKKQYKNEYDKISEHLHNLSSLEKENCADIDKVADCFANILKILFTPSFITDEATRRALEWLGYNTGRWIYIIDAFNDIEKDLKKKSYNPFIAKSGITKANITEKRTELAQSVSLSMDYTLSNIASAYELLKIYKNDDILRNIIYIGLREKQDFIMKENKVIENESI